ncbi:MAG: sugar porter family MFS transporter [Planctomycetaceae bacterium]|jgi:sugar porter (SP) family MFS transporter|nr:sugar porter family MFS transporter [Planctomycetaceae bacterium]
MKPSSLVLRSALIAAIGGLLFGFDTAVISGTIDSLKTEFLLGDWYLGFTVAAALFGTILGAATAQIPSNIIGRKPTLIIMAVFYFVSAVASACPWNFGTLTAADWHLFLWARFIGGIAVGASSVVSPLYTAEISPAKRRGFLVALTQFNIVFGILLAFFSNYVIAAMNIGDTAWRWMFAVEAVPAAAFFFFLFIVPESPRWLISKGETEKAKKIIEALRTNKERTADEEVQVIQNAIEEEKRNGKESLFTYKLRFPIMLAICMAAFNQLSGINAILYYAPKVFTIAGASKDLSMFFPVIIGFTNLVFTMAALPLIDKFGRKTLMLAGSLGYISSLCVVAGAFIVYEPEFNRSIQNVNLAAAKANVETADAEFEAAKTEEEKIFREQALAAANRIQTEAEEAVRSAAEHLADVRGEDSAGTKDTVPLAGIIIVLGGLMLFIASHAFGQGACIWVFIGEIFPNTVRAQGQALGSFVHWILAALITQLFPPLLALLGPANIFLVFAGMMFGQLLWVVFLMPETKQVPLEEMQKKLGII